MNVLVIGATGFLGSHLCRRLVTDGNSVLALIRPQSNVARLDGIAVTLLHGDVTEIASIRAAVQDVDYVINSAAVISCGRDLKPFTTVNVDGAANVARVCHAAGVKRLLHISSVGAIGIPPKSAAPADEDFAFNLEQSGLAYQNSKRRGEEAVRNEARLGLNAVIVNPGWIFGRDKTRFRGWEVVSKVRGRRIVPYYRGGLCAVHIEDVVTGALLALTAANRGTRYILGGENVSFRSVAERAARRFGDRPLFVRVPSAVTAIASVSASLKALMLRRPSSMPWASRRISGENNFYSSLRAQEALGYSPRNFDSILDDMFRFAESRGLLSPQEAGARDSFAHVV